MDQVEKFIAILMFLVMGMGVVAWLDIYELPNNVATFILGMAAGAYITWALSPEGKASGQRQKMYKELLNLLTREK